LNKYKAYILVWSKKDGSEPRSKSLTVCTPDFFQKTYTPLVTKEIEGYYCYKTEEEAREMWPYIRV